MTNENTSNKMNGLSFVEEEAWDNADVNQRQSNLRHALSLLYSNDHDDSKSETNTAIIDGKMEEEDIRATITFTDDEVEKSLQDERTTIESGYGNSTDDAFSLSDIEDQHHDHDHDDYDDYPQQQTTNNATTTISNNSNRDNTHPNDYNTSHTRKIDSSNINHSYVYSTLSNPSFGSKIDIIGGSSSFHTQTQYSSFQNHQNNI